MVNELTRENFDKAIKEHSIAVVEFYSATCKHCKKLEAGITELSEEAGNEVYFGKVLIPDQLSLAEEYEIVSQDPEFSREYCVNLCDSVWGDLWKTE